MLDRCRKVAAEQGIPYEDLDVKGLAERFPFFAFPEEIAGLYETGTGGWINPRHHVLAEVAAAEAGGATVHRAEVARVNYEPDSVVVHCADGTQFEGQKAVIAFGAFSKTEELLVEPLPMTVYARTVAFLEIDAAEAERLARIPSMIYMAPDLRYGPYMLPPVQYSDGKTYLKIGGDPEDIALDTVADMKAWFQGAGDKNVAEDLANILIGLMPGLDCKGIRGIALEV